MHLFGKKYSTIKVKRKEFPKGLWTKCPSCLQLIYTNVLNENFKVCPKCGYHFSLTAYERIDQVLDPGSFIEMDKNLETQDPLEFKGVKGYKRKLEDDKKATSLNEAAVTGRGIINGHKVVFGVTDSRFIMGSMGSVVGEKITRAVEYAIDKKLPVIFVSGSGGGARMYEGALSLMQMAKTSAAIAKLHKKGLLFISILSNPTMGGVLASFASLGDILISEPNALVGFAGPRVIKQTIKQDLPEGFQRPEFLLEHGLIDMILPRKELRPTIISILNILQYNEPR